MVLALGLTAGPVTAASELDAVITEVEASVPAEYADLVAYRRSVERRAYRETMKLCGGYRVLRGLGAGHAGGDWTAWTRVLGHGLVQPFSAAGGLKGQYNTANHVRIWEPDAWFRSIYTLYLVNSDGFVAAATHCLNTTDPNELRWFSAAIMGVDIIGSVPGQVAFFWTVSKALGLALRATRPLWSPVTRVIGRLTARINRRTVVVGGLVIVPIAGGAAFEYLEHLRIGLNSAKGFVENVADEQFRMVRTKRILLMSEAVEKLGAGIDAGSLDAFEAWAIANVRATDLAEAHRDFEAIRMNESNEPTDDGYFKVLRAVLPVLDQLQLKP